MYENRSQTPPNQQELYATSFLANVFAVCRRPSVCRLSVTFVCPTHAIEIFGSVSTPFGTLAICDLSIKILRRLSMGNPSIREVKPKPNIAILDLSKAISRKRCKIGGKLLLITNSKSHMSFRLVPKSVTLNDLERHNSRNLCVISRNSVAFWADYVKVVEDTPILPAAEM